MKLIFRAASGESDTEDDEELGTEETHVSVPDDDDDEGEEADDEEEDQEEAMDENNNRLVRARPRFRADGDFGGKEKRMEPCT